MNYTKYERALSKARMNRFLIASQRDESDAIRLYQLNIQLSQQLFGFIGIFEVTLRNHIDEYYKLKFNDFEWLKNQATEDGIFNHPSFISHQYQSRNHILKIIDKLKNNYHHDKLISALNFGFWVYMFAPLQFRAGGQGLHHIFIRRPKGTNRKIIFEELDNIRRLRNRIAHHEPLCFDKHNNLSITKTMNNYQIIIRYMDWMGYTPGELFHELNKIHTISENILSIK